MSPSGVPVVAVPGDLLVVGEMRGKFNPDPDTGSNVVVGVRVWVVVGAMVGVFVSVGSREVRVLVAVARLVGVVVNVALEVRTGVGVRVGVIVGVVVGDGMIAATGSDKSLVLSAFSISKT